MGSANSFQQSPTPVSLKLSTLLRPLTSNSEHGSSTDGSGSIPAGAVKMPSYSTSMSLGQTITDPIEGGMISLAASRELYEFFMFQMNAKWEYILDPRVDTHDQIRQRSQLLFATILFGASKFANHVNGRIVSIPDPVLQTRLCSLARNLVVRALAEGDRSIETMQALYLLVCWKDGDDDVSYLHSGYAYRVLQDMDLEQSDGDGWQRARRRRTWLALYRQDRQQRLFFMRRASLAQNDENHYLLSNPNTWLEMECALPLDMIACGSADLRRIQSKLRHLVERASSEMLPCLLDLMHGELSEWKAKWSTYLLTQGGTWTGSSSANASLDPELLFPDTGHLRNLIHLWDHSVRLNISSAVLRQSLMAAVTSSLDSPIPRHSSPDTFTFPDLDLPTLQRVLSPDLPGLSTSVEGAFGVLRHLLCIPPNDLRRAPDAVLLLAPNAALFLCLLLCLPENGILGMTFQRTAVTLIHDIARHVGNCVQSPQDTVVLHTAYLGSLVGLLNGSQQQQQQQGLEAQPPMGIPPLDVCGNGLCLDSQPIRPPQVLAGGYSMDNTSSVLGSPGDSGNNLHLQSVANLLDGDLFWEMPLTSESGGIGD